jgi:hypothetical protein
MLAVARWLAPIAFILTLGAPIAKARSLTETFGVAAAGSEASVDHSQWSALLKKYVVVSPDGVNRVRYAAFKSEAHATLKSYIAALETVDVRALDRPEQFAFWVNLYNAKTIDVVLDAYPVRSIKDISLGGGLLTLVTGGPWKAKVMKVNGVELSLDDVEHGILRPIFKDPRVHYAVNCASIGCPNLMAEAFTGAALKSQLDAAARAYVNHPRGFSERGGEIVASSIYDWFATDFESAGGVIAHARAYADQALKRKLSSTAEPDKYEYDWSLNDAPN